jgi:lysylphosphatidylglycerol synthetase-like protein (DUF2156 family)
MDPSTFDTLTRAITQTGTRRRALATLIGVTIAGSLGRGEGTAKAKRQHHKRRVRAQKGSNSQTAKRCQKGGWATLARAGDPTVAFTSENACVSYGARGAAGAAGGEPVPRAAR